MKKISILLLVIYCLLVGVVSWQFWPDCSKPSSTISPQQEINNLIWEVGGWRYTCKFQTSHSREIGLLYYKDKIVTLFRFTENKFKFQDGDRITTPWGQMQFFCYDKSRWGFFLKDIDETRGRLFTLEQVTDVREDDGMAH